MTVVLDSASKGATTVITGGTHASATSNINNGARGDLLHNNLTYPAPQNRYWVEFTNNFVSLATDSGSGLVVSASPNYSNLAADATGGLIIYRSGAIWVNGVNIGRAVTGGIRFDSVMLLLDFDRNLMWAKTPGNAFWLDSALADPVAGVLGIDISGISGAGLYPLGLITSLANSFDANFGASPSINTPPASYGPWDGVPPVLPTLHAIHNARMRGFATGATAIAQQTGASLTLATTEPPDVFSGVIQPTVGMDLLVTEAADTFHVVPPETYNVGALNTPRALADDDVIYVLENNETIYVEGDISSSFVIHSEDIMYAT